MKRNYWPLFFIGIFTFTFSLIVWTIYSAVKVPVHEDDAFFKKYQYVDDNFNNLMNSNKNFLSKYDFKLKVNDKYFDLDTKDMFLGQRVIEKKSKHKDTLKVGKNHIEIAVFDKTGKFVDNLQISFRITKSSNNNSIIDKTNSDFKKVSSKYITDIKIPIEGNWNIIASFKTANDKAYLFLKTNAI